MSDVEKLKAEADTAFRTGQLDSARTLYEKVIAERSEHVAAHNNLAMVLRQLGERSAAEHHFRKALEQDPDQANALSNLGALLVEQNRLDEAEPLLDRALERTPESPGGFYNRALLFQARRDLERAAQDLQKAIQLNPSFANAHVNLGTVLRQLGRTEESMVTTRQALALDATSFEANLNLGAVLSEQGDIQQALHYCRKALELDPESPEANYNYGNVLLKIPEFEAALTHFDKTLTLKPDHKQAAVNRAKAFWALDRRDEAYASLNLALEIDPGFAAAHSNIVFKHQYDIDQTPPSLYALARQWNTDHAATEPIPFNRPINRDTERVLNVGFLSPHFSRHPVGYFVEPVAKHHNASAMKLFCYADGQRRDDISERIQSYTDVWCDIAGEGEDALHRRIQTDAIDILVDLDGHSGPNHLPLFARRAAPLQVTWAGYVGTTGLDSMDYLITDNRQTLVEDIGLMAEKPVYMPGNYVCIEPIDQAPDLGPIPSESAGHVTFGCFNTLDKVNEAVIETWAACLHAVPDSRLKLITFDLGDETVRARIAAQFKKHGIDNDHLTLTGRVSHKDLLAAYNSIDIALDPFPYSGGLTTLEALWMGVPVVTKKDGDRFASRHSVTHLTAVGLTETIADTVEDYVKRTTDLADDVTRRKELKQTLRDRMRQSPACDGAAFTQALEKAFRIMWRRYCNGEEPSPITATDLH